VSCALPSVANRSEAQGTLPIVAKLIASYFSASVTVTFIERRQAYKATTSRNDSEAQGSGHLTAESDPRGFTW